MIIEMIHMQEYKAKKVHYDAEQLSPSAAETSHLQHVKAGEMSHEHEHKPMEHKMKPHKMHKKEEVVLVEPTEKTSAFSFHQQALILGDGVGVSARVRVKGQEISNGFG